MQELHGTRLIGTRSLTEWHLLGSSSFPLISVILVPVSKVLCGWDTLATLGMVEQVLISAVVHLVALGVDGVLVGETS